jgi:anti-sigma-K factor RskA
MTPELLEQAARYVLGELDTAEAAAFERRFADDAELAREVETLHRLIGLLPLGAAVDPPPELRVRVLEAAKGRPVPPAPRRVTGEPVAPAPRPASPLVPRLVGAVAALLALALGIDAYRARRELALERELQTALQQPNVVLTFALAGRGEARGAAGRVNLDLDARRAAVALHGLAPLPADRVYGLWAMVGARAVPCGAFRATPDGNVLAQFAVPVDAYTAKIVRLFLTIEPAPLPFAPTGPTLMESL